MKKPVEVIENQSLKKFSSLKIGGRAEYFAQPKNLEQLKTIVSWGLANKLKFTLFSGATNVLFSDGIISGLVLCLNQMRGVETAHKDSHIEIVAMAGTPKSELVRIFLKANLDPALFLAGLPGDVGGGVTMNAGVSEDIVPKEFCEIVDWVEVLKWDDAGQIEVLRFEHQDLDWRYRKSLGWQPGIIVRVGMKWDLLENPEILNKVKTASKNRVSKQPLNLPNCGSVFRNPKGNKAAQLIDDCGLKGYRIGGAEISTKHANFIVNVDNAKASDVDELIKRVQKHIKEKKNIVLETEVIRLGDWDKGTES